jgi:nitrogen regulatory protein P-II 1
VIVFFAKNLQRLIRKVYLTICLWLSMKEISVYINNDDLARVTEILRKHNVGGISFYEVHAAGRRERDAVPEMVRNYMTGRMVTPDFIKRTKLEIIVSDSVMNEIVDDISNSLGQDAAVDKARGMIFIKDVSDAIEIGGTKDRGEAALTRK